MLTWSFAAIKNRNNYDVVFTRNFGIQYYFAGIVAKRLLRKKLVLWLSGSRKTGKGFRGKFYRPFLKDALKISDAITTSSNRVINEIESYLVKIDQAKVTIINQPVDISKFNPSNTHSLENVILCVARIDPVKGIDDIIQALPYVIKSIPNVKLVVAGFTSDKNYLKHLKLLAKQLGCERHVEFVGGIPHDELVGFYNSSKIFILTSKMEGESIATREAMACGKPVIVTPVGALPDLIDDGINGLLVKNNQPSILAEKIISLLVDDNYREMIGRAARLKIETESNWNSYLNGLTKVFQQVTEINEKTNA